MKNYKIRTEYDCLVKHKDGETFLDLNSEISFDSPQKILVYPLRRTSKVSYPFSIDLDDSSENRFFRRFSFEQTQYIYINALPFFKNEVIEKITVGQDLCNVRINEEQICFETENYRKSLLLENLYSSYNIYSEKGLVFLHLIGNEELLLIFSIKNHSLKIVSGTKIEKIENQILCSKEVNDFANRQVYEYYEISEDEVRQKNIKIKYNLQEPNLTANPNIIPMAFLEAIKIEDYEIAKKYLCDELRNNTTDVHLKKYFGNFSSFLNLKNSTLAIINSEKILICQFVINESKIQEINLIN